MPLQTLSIESERDGPTYVNCFLSIMHNMSTQTHSKHSNSFGDCRFQVSKHCQAGEAAALGTGFCYIAPCLALEMTVNQRAWRSDSFPASAPKYHT